MINAIKNLASSKRAIIALVTAVADVLVITGVDVTPEKTQAIITVLTTLGGVLIAGISVTDYGKALGKPAGVDHKDRV